MKRLSFHTEQSMETVVLLVYLGAFGGGGGIGRWGRVRRKWLVGN